MADPLQCFTHLSVLDLELALVGDHLPGDTRVIGDRRDPLGARLEDLQRARMRVTALALVQDGPHTIAGNGAGDEHDVATVAEPGDALAAEGQRVDLQLQLVTALRTD